MTVFPQRRIPWLAGLALALSLTLTGCQPDESARALQPDDDTGAADVVAVAVSESAGSFTFSVTVASPDTGCDQYADWWEVLSEDGDLLYRRVLLHSHVDEQPFTRSGGPVALGANELVIVRAHMSNTGFGGLAMQGTVHGGFVAVELPQGFALEVVQQAPLPQSCAF